MSISTDTLTASTSKLSEKDSVREFNPETIERLKSEEEYQYKSPVVQVNGWWDLLMLRVGRFLKSVIGSNGFGYLVIIMVFSVFIAIVVVIAVRGQFDTRVGAEKRFGVASGNPLMPTDIPPQQLLQQALSEGDYRMAFRWRYIIFLQRLSELGAIALTPDKTNLDYQRELRETEYSEMFCKLSRVFDYVWYGHRAIDRDGYQELEGLFNKIGHVPI